MKILALDLGDVHVGTAITDALGMCAFPHKTVDAWKLIDFLQEILAHESIHTIIVGYPRTLRGTISEQTNKIVTTKESLEKQFNTITWILWDERLTSKHAAHYSRSKNKQDKHQVHSIAASLILESYLEHLRFNEKV
jgi:putative holliday junction resolvase